jgi:hypothetical protein
LRKTPYRWLDLQKLCQLLLPRNTISEIKYFTALVSARPADPNQTVRQQVYLRALGTLPNVSIHYGHFLTHEITMPGVPVPGRRQEYVRVIKTEEKGSDVNLATHVLHDAHMGRFEVAVVVSNDSDLLEPIKIVRDVLHKKVGILNPHKKPSRAAAAYRFYQANPRRRASGVAIPGDDERPARDFHQAVDVVRNQG